MYIAIVKFIQGGLIFRQTYVVTLERVREIKRQPNVLSVVYYPQYTREEVDIYA